MIATIELTVWRDRRRMSAAVTLPCDKIMARGEAYTPFVSSEYSVKPVPSNNVIASLVTSRSTPAISEVLDANVPGW